MRNLLLFILMLMLSACNTNIWTNEEKDIIASSSPLRVLTIENEDDLLVLRQKSKNLLNDELLSSYYNTLAEKLIATVTHPSQDGVGIAGPQVGINRRVIAVQRVDKTSEPFEVYPNIEIIAMRGEFQKGSEGCLSVPNRRGEVMRSYDIDIRYSIINKGVIKDTIETITGFAAVIFQHECDHLDGVLYIDKLE